MARREPKKPKQPPYILLDHNVQVRVADSIKGLVRVRQIGEHEQEHRFRRDAADPEIHRGARRFLFATHDQDFLRQDRLPNEHGGILVLICPPQRASVALRTFFEWWGSKRNLLRSRVFRLTTTGGVEILRDGTIRPIYRQPAGDSGDTYGD